MSTEENVLDGISDIFSNPSGITVKGFSAGLEEDDDDSEYQKAMEQAAKVKIPSPAAKKKVEKEIEDLDDDDEDEDEELIKPKRKVGRPKKETPPVEDDDDDDDDDEKSDENNDNDDDEDDTPASLFFDAVAEGLGLELTEEEEKPRDVEGIVKYFVDLINEESTPIYASEETKMLDDYVRNGGSLTDYFNHSSGDNYENFDISIESNQRKVVRDFLLEKGFSEAQVQKKITKYVDADILEDEAADALESMKEITEDKQKKLLEDQKNAQENAIKSQQKWVDDVVYEIKALDNVRGIPIPRKEKESLLAFILKRDSEGNTEFNKKYAENPIRNFLELAYFVKNGDSLVEDAKKLGQSSAMKSLKQSLNSSSAPKGSGKRLKGNSDNNKLFSLAAQSFR